MAYLNLCLSDEAGKAESSGTDEEEGPAPKAEKTGTDNAGIGITSEPDGRID
jgi:hypothetical protein